MTALADIYMVGGPVQVKTEVQDVKLSLQNLKIDLEIRMTGIEANMNTLIMRQSDLDPESRSMMAKDFRKCIVWWRVWRRSREQSMKAKEMSPQGDFACLLSSSDIL